MAYINPDIYKNGLKSYFCLSEAELATILGDNKLFIVLSSEELTNSSTNLKTLVLASSGAIDKSGKINYYNTEDENAPAVIGNNSLFSFENSTLFVKQLDYNKTVSTNNTGAVANYFSIILASEGTKTPTYKSETGTQYSIKVPNFEEDVTVLISGNISNSVTINTDSNFQFTQTTISFATSNS